MITFKVTGQEAVVARLRSFTPEVTSRLLPTIHGILVDLQRHVVADKLHGGNPLHSRSGRLAGNINISPIQTSEMSIKGSVGTNVVYAAIHEYGGTIPAHDVFPKNKQALAFNWKGKDVIFKSVHIPTIQMPQRSFLRSALADYREIIINRIRNSVNGR
jgi:phage gpG-like protein